MSGSLVWSAAGRFCYDHEERMWEVGYLDRLPAVADPLFLGEAGAGTAQLTFAAEPVRVNVFDHWLETLSRPGRLTVYQQDPPGSSYRDLTTFRSREPIAIFERYSLERGRPAQQPEATDGTSTFVFTATLIWSRIFELNDGIYDLRDVVKAPLEQRIVASEVPPRTRARPGSIPRPETSAFQAVMPFVGQARLKTGKGLL